MIFRKESWITWDVRVAAERGNNSCSVCRSTSVHGLLSGNRGRFGVSLAAFADILDRSDGREARLSLFFPFERGSWSITPSVGASWQDDDLIDYYYGVRPEEELPGRPAYEGESTVNGHVGINLMKRFESGWMFVTFFNLESLGSEISDSPIVDDDFAASGVVGFVYNF